MNKTNNNAGGVKKMVKEKHPGDVEREMIAEREERRAALQEEAETTIEKMIGAPDDERERLAKRHAAALEEAERLRLEIDALFRRRHRVILEHHDALVTDARKTEAAAREKATTARARRDEITTRLRIAKNGGRATRRRQQLTADHADLTARLAGAEAEAIEHARRLHRDYEAAVSRRKAAEAARDRAVKALAKTEGAKRPRPVQYNAIRGAYVALPEMTM